ncbi:MAG: nucleotidyltransferase substrate binding protein [Deltaproteobacteria bacterium]|nr:nucleotidyltransferase substrate binding protein [Deltaproteobacteria bacterium]
MDARSAMSHTYDFSKFEQVIADTARRYLAAMEELYMFFLAAEADYGG